MQEEEQISPVTSAYQEEKENPFAIFTEWESENDEVDYATIK